MSLTLTDIIYRLKQLDEVDVTDILGLTTEDLVDRFADVIEDKADLLEQLLKDDDDN
jgi:hypothetical protein